jgi:hypothetical protein
MEEDTLESHLNGWHKKNPSVTKLMDINHRNILIIPLIYDSKINCNNGF